MKTYIKPTTTVVATAIHQMLCLSANIDGEQTITDSGMFGTHQDNGWDIWGNNADDDFEDYD